MLDKISHRKFSKTSRLIIIIGAIVIILLIFIYLLVKANPKTINTEESRVMLGQIAWF
jgi:uncharacterized protein YpmB